MAKAWAIISWVLSLDPVQGALVALFLYWLGKLFVKHQWLQNITKLATDAYTHAEEQGLVQNLKGYQKWDPFFDKFVEAFRKKYGYEPKPKDRAAAVEYVEKRVLDEHKEDGL